jgi:hypothetical protein
MKEMGSTALRSREEAYRLELLPLLFVEKPTEKQSQMGLCPVRALSTRVYTNIWEANLPIWIHRDLLKTSLWIQFLKFAL